MQIKHTNALDSSVYEDALAIRKAVFVVEQGVPLELELDQEDRCEHFVGYVDEQAIATARLLPEDGGFHVQRVAVLKPERKKGYGRALLLALEDYARNSGAEHLSLDAQLHAIPFYEQLGYALTDKPEFLDAGMPHREMVLALND